MPVDWDQPCIRCGSALGSMTLMEGGWEHDDAIECVVYERDRLRGILDQVIHDIANEGYAAWSSDLHQEVYGR